MTIVARSWSIALVLVLMCVAPASADDDGDHIPVSCTAISEEKSNLELGDPPVWTKFENNKRYVYLFIPTGFAQHHDNQTAENGTENGQVVTFEPSVGIGEDGPTLEGYVVVAWICALIEDIMECLGHGTVDGLVEAALRFVGDPSATNACLPL